MQHNPARLARATPTPRSIEAQESLSEAGQAISQGLIVFDADARVRAFNTAAVRLLHAHTPLDLSLLPGVPGGAQRITGADIALQMQIEQAVHDCAIQDFKPPRARTPPARSARTLRLSRVGAASGLVLRLSAIGEAARRAHGAHAAVLGQFAELRRSGHLDCSRLVELFDLSASSARVAEAYLRVDSVKDVARELGISANTVKTHLATVYERTQCSRRSQLIRLLMSLSVQYPG
jgi:DNA-binding CsgD family transcriptional regulator